MSYVGGKRNTKHVRFDNVEWALEGLTTTVSECAEDRRNGEPCSSKKIINIMEAFAIHNKSKNHVLNNAVKEPGVANAVSIAAAVVPTTLLPSAPTPEARIVREVANILNCTAESCILQHPNFNQFVVSTRAATAEHLKHELDKNFKAKGPRDTLALLSNYDIDGTLQRWGRVFTDFFPCPFAMMDFDSNGDMFGEISFPNLLKGRAVANLGAGMQSRGPFKCFGCVVNTDVSSGPGKHWVAVFVDCRDAVWTVEYFNSVGRPPPRPMVAWMERTRSELESFRGGEVNTVSVTDVDHQESQTECGLYSLYYIRRRLEGTPFAFFETKLIPDDAMTLFRKHIFRVF